MSVAAQSADELKTQLAHPADEFLLGIKAVEDTVAHGLGQRGGGLPKMFEIEINPGFAGFVLFPC
jgi:hypothetical protein